jgi:two-component system sensor histidine kinase PhoQ
LFFKHQAYSLRRRLLVSASLLLLVFLGLMGLVLNDAFRQSVLSNAEDALRNQVLLLMSNIDLEDTTIVVPPVLSEPRLMQADSTLYAQISAPENGITWRSESLLGGQLPAVDSPLGVFNFAPQAQWAGAGSIYLLSFGAAWETAQGDVPFTVTVAENQQAYLNRIKRYQRRIVLWLSILGVSLLVLLLGLLSWGLQPLVRVTRQVGEIERGDRQRFDEDYPEEVSRLTQNLNQLLNFEAQRIERQKNVLGNLAHSLKTPLAVLRGLKYSSVNQEDVMQQLGAMQTIIDYQLQSASAVGRRRFAKPISVLESTQQLMSSLQKLHREKNLKVTVDISDTVQFFGDAGDWMELIGNLLDNAFKWAKSQVSISVRNIQMPVSSHRLATEIIVSDDGIGIDDELKTTILQRGVRLDSQTPGHGLGLHIVKGVVEAYEGEISVEDNSQVTGQDSNGTRFTVVLR